MKCIPSTDPPVDYGAQPWRKDGRDGWKGGHWDKRRNGRWHRDGWRKYINLVSEVTVAKFPLLIMDFGAIFFACFQDPMCEASVILQFLSRCISREGKLLVQLLVQFSKQISHRFWNRR